MKRLILLGVLAVALVPAAVSWACGPQSHLRLDKPAYSGREQVEVIGNFFRPGHQLTLRVEPGGTVGTVTPSSNGSFATSITAPATAGAYVLSAIGYEPDGSVTPGLPARVSLQVHTTDRDCSDFPNQAAAQDYFISRGGPGSDPDRLDGNNDGIACESLPCPCPAGTGPPPPQQQLLPPIPIFQDPSAPARRPNFSARVVKVVDGDTLKVRSTGGRRFTVRLIGVDAPEVFGARECGGREASARMKRLAPRGRKVRVTGDPTQPTRDRQGRLLAYVKTSTTQLNLAQIRWGWARVPVVDRPFLHYERFVSAESRSRTLGRGTWSRCGGNFDRRL